MENRLKFAHETAEYGFQLVSAFDHGPGHHRWIQSTPGPRASNRPSPNRNLSPRKESRCNKIHPVSIEAPITLSPQVKSLNTQTPLTSSKDIEFGRFKSQDSLPTEGKALQNMEINPEYGLPHHTLLRFNQRCTHLRPHVVIDAIAMLLGHISTCLDLFVSY